MSRRKALLIGNNEFKDRESFPNLRTPGNDAKDFASTLQNFGEFEITNLIINQDANSIKTSIEDFYNETERGDLVIVYYSGHGYIDKHGNYYLIAKDTSKNHLLTTGISEDFITSAMHVCRSFHRVLILDCCFSGVLARDKKGEAESILLAKLQGEAIAILTSSSSTQKSYEEKETHSLFTKYLISGIASGQADKDGDGYIGIDELFQFAERKVREVRPEQTPTILLRSRESRILIATNPKVSVKKRLEEIDVADLPFGGIVTGDQRLTLIELCVKLLNRLHEFEVSFQKAVNKKGKAMSTSEQELNKRLVQSQFTASSAARSTYTPYYSRGRYSDFSSTRTRANFSDSIGPMLAMLAHAMESSSISDKFLQEIKEELQQIHPLIKPISQMAVQTGLDKSDLWAPVEKSFVTLRSAISAFNRKNARRNEDNENVEIETIERLIKEISTTESNLSKLIGGLDSWKIFDDGSRSAKWFHRKIKHAYELHRGDEVVKEKVQELIDSLADSISDNMVKKAIKPSFYSWREGKIRTLSEMTSQISKLSKHWQTSDEGKELFLSHVKKWHKTLEADVNEMIRPVYKEFDIPSSLLDSTNEIFGVKNDHALSGANVSFDTGVQEIGKVADAVLVMLGVGVGVGGLLIPGIGEIELLLGLIYVVSMILVTVGGNKMVSESMPDKLRKKIMNANLPRLLRNRVNDKKLKKVFEEARTEAEDSISTALRKNINDDDVIHAVWQDIDAKVDLAVKYMSQQK